jgi:hypothetical protein
MPFIKQNRRELAGKGQLPDTQVGDICYMMYKPMVDEWKKNPCWTTAHHIKKSMLHGLHLTHVGGLACDDCTARHLAWDVFLYKYVLPYENQKELENGTI